MKYNDFSCNAGLLITGPPAGICNEIFSAVY
jgi:hypothetical protein